MSRWRYHIGPVIHLAAYKRLQSLPCHSDFYNSTNTFQILSLIIKDQTPKFSEKFSRTFITETLTVSKIFEIHQIHINTKLNSTNYCANQSKLTRTLRDSSRTFIIEFVPSQFKHIVRSRRVLRREEEELK